MQFIADNYIWFFVAGIVFLMTFIGYIAEKTDFGRKEIKKTENKEKKLKKDVKKLEKNNLKLNDVVYTENNKDVEIIDINKVEEEDPFAFNDLNDNSKTEDLAVPLNGEQVETAPLMTNVIEENLTVPLNGNLQTNSVEEISTEATIEEDLTVPLNGNPHTNDVEEIVETQKEEVNNISNDDIWKF